MLLFTGNSFNTEVPKPQMTYYWIKELPEHIRPEYGNEVKDKEDVTIEPETTLDPQIQAKKDQITQNIKAQKNRFKLLQKEYGGTFQ